MRKIVVLGSVTEIKSDGKVVSAVLNSDGSVVAVVHHKTFVPPPGEKKRRAG